MRFITLSPCNKLLRLVKGPTLGINSTSVWTPSHIHHHLTLFIVEAPTHSQVRQCSLMRRYVAVCVPHRTFKNCPGKGKAQKEQVAFMVQRLLGIKKEIKPLDISDAMAVAITHAQRVKLSK